MTANETGPVSLSDNGNRSQCNDRVYSQSQEDPDLKMLNELAAEIIYKHFEKTETTVQIVSEAITFAKNEKKNSRISRNKQLKINHAVNIYKKIVDGCCDNAVLLEGDACERCCCRRYLLSTIQRLDIKKESIPFSRSDLTNKIPKNNEALVFKVHDLLNMLRWKTPETKKRIFKLLTDLIKFMELNKVKLTLWVGETQHQEFSSPVLKETYRKVIDDVDKWIKTRNKIFINTKKQLSDMLVYFLIATVHVPSEEYPSLTIMNEKIDSISQRSAVNPFLFTINAIKHYAQEKNIDIPVGL